jgi:predicted membrane-bound spermidine synthase
VLTRHTLVFACGATTMALEIAAARLFAPHFGTALPVWANLIGLILTYLAAGSWLGGRLAGRPGVAVRLGTFAGAGGVLTAVVPLVAGPVLDRGGLALSSVDLGLVVASFVSAALVLGAPTVVLGAVLPLAIGAADGAGAVRAGSLIALSTLGGILGVFASALVAVPLLGTRGTFAVFGLGVAALAVLALRREAPRRAVALAALALGVAVALAVSAQRAPRTPRPPSEALRATLEREGALTSGGPQPEVTFVHESAYHLVQVARAGDARWLVLDEAAGVQSLYRPGAVLTGRVWDDFLVAPLLARVAGGARVRRALVLGLAGGTVARGLAGTWAPAVIDGVELDPVVVDAARAEFDTGAIPSLVTHIGDARRFVTTSTARYDLVIVDAFRGPYVPFHLTTSEFFAALRARLAPGGVVAVNVPFTETHTPQLASAVGATLAGIFPAVVVIERRDAYNAVLVAGDLDLDAAAFSTRVRALPAGSLLARAARDAAGRWQAFSAPPGTSPLTDDRAPVEWLTDNMVWREIR